MSGFAQTVGPTSKGLHKYCIQKLIAYGKSVTSITKLTPDATGKRMMSFRQGKQIPEDNGLCFHVQKTSSKDAQSIRLTSLSGHSQNTFIRRSM